MNRLVTAFGFFLLPWPILYVVMVFITQQPNPVEWSQDGRAFYAGCCLLAGWVGALLSTNDR